ncbi:MAG: hypothetical protein ACH349_00925 [Candidatus Rhabdochlamydia sp.]|jgi:hypothetical protein|nr:hypothetical protein [Chlamydiota bacterium]
MSIQPIANPSIEVHAKPVVLSKMQWLGRQISTFGKTLYPQLTKITHLFYQIIRTHPKKTLAILTGTTITVLIYYKGKALITFLKSFNKDCKEKTLQQKINTLSKQFSEESKKVKQQFSIIENNIKDISEVQTTILESINNEQLRITNQHALIQNDLKKLTESKPTQNALPKEKIAVFETNINSLPALNQKITKLITETNNYKTHLAQFSNPFNFL